MDLPKNASDNILRFKFNNQMGLESQMQKLYCIVMLVQSYEAIWLKAINICKWSPEKVRNNGSKIEPSKVRK